MTAFIMITQSMASAQTAIAPQTVDPNQISVVHQRFYGDPLVNQAALVGGTTSCSAGQRLVGMGYVGAADGNVVSALAPNSTYTGAYMLGGVLSQSPSNFIQVSALCAPASGFADALVGVVTDHRVDSAGSDLHFFTDTAKCPAGYYAFGGGGYFSRGGVPARAAFILGNGPAADGNGWSFTAQNPGAVESLKVFVQCAPRTGHEVVVETRTTSVTGAMLRSAYAQCPAGATPISGGWSVLTASNLLDLPAGNGEFVVRSVTSAGGPDTVHNGLQSWYANAFVAKAGDKLAVRAQCLLP